MAVLLSILSLVLGAAALVLGWRARRASLRLALEMIELRDRLAQAEHGTLASEEADSMRRKTDTERDQSLAPRLIALEERVRGALETESPPAASDAPEFDPRAHVREHLKRRGYERIAVLGAADDGSLAVEVERAGVVSKGHVVIGDDGRVHLRSVSSLRAFP